MILGLSREINIDLYVTASNSKMLSSDIITEFRDKAVNIAVAPLSVEEFCEYRGISEIEALYEYMQYGGMPLAVLKSENEKKEYLRQLFDTTYFRDIIERNHLRKSESLDELCNILSESTGQLLNSEKLANTYKSVKKDGIDKHTVEKYIDYFKDSFLIREARRFDLKGRQKIGVLRKYYFEDTGLRNARLNFIYPDEGQMIENIVFNELLYNGYSVSVIMLSRPRRNMMLLMNLNTSKIRNIKKYLRKKIWISSIMLMCQILLSMYCYKCIYKQIAGKCRE